MERMGSVPLERMPIQHLRLLAGDPLPGIPSTAIFSKSDSIVPWRIAVQTPTDISENIEVYASHIGLGFNPTVLYAVSDRLANKDGDWQPFQRTTWKRSVYGPANISESTGTN